MSIRSDEIISVLRREIENFSTELKTVEAGIVMQVGDGVARVHGLPKAMSGDLVEFANGVKGFVLNLEEDNVGCLIFGSDEGIHEGDLVKDTEQILSVPVGKGLLGRVVDPLGQPIDGEGPILPDSYRRIESDSPNIVQRQPVCEPLQTGIQAIDALIPIGRGQRELIIGDRQTGKTTIAIDTIINQKDTGVICIYVAIGQKMSTITQIVETLKKHGALDHTIVVAASASEPAPLQFIAPFSGCAMGEYFRDKGGHVLCVYDDLSKHATAYRQVSLLLRRPPGREAYPADIFYLHARLLERAAKLSEVLNGGSLTALPIIETQAGDASAYIPTNVISITDGQIVLESGLFNSGVRPAINAGLSVSRVGGSAQVKGMKKVAGPLRLDLAQYRELAAFSQFSKDLDRATQDQLARGERLVELLKQPQHTPMPVEDQIVTILAATRGFTDTLQKTEIVRFKKFLLKNLHQKHPEIMHNFKEKPELTPEMEQRLVDLIEHFLNDVYMLQYHPERHQAEKEKREAEERQLAAEKAAAEKKHGKAH
ncbi:MAG TPA: F0F1 ATP synthase subunit alpha [Candidatus Rifleibacterium sp.]|nr:F0F1 ATP synthase subunit alpha [Candidatus Rifleibacterium sp.]HPT45999.1 F0F1 ATP synthase subunit alpha [Candidatus Rifleibacterium sp.]